MERILVSACLLGRPVRYDGRAKPSAAEWFSRWRAEGRLVPVCPEVDGGLPVPRPPAEITTITDGRSPSRAVMWSSEFSATRPADAMGASEPPATARPTAPRPEPGLSGNGASGNGAATAGRPADGNAVLDGRARVITADGNDVTDAFLTGAAHALAVAQRTGISMAVLKENSPSCAGHRLYDGTFSGHLIEGIGVTTALLERHGIRVFSENECEAAATYLASLEHPRP